MSQHAARLADTVRSGQASSRLPPSSGRQPATSNLMAMLNRHLVRLADGALTCAAAFSAIGYGTQISMIDSASLPLVRIAPLIGTPLNTLTALGDGSIHALDDLKGKTIGYSVAGMEDASSAPCCSQPASPGRTRRW